MTVLAVHGECLAMAGCGQARATALAWTHEPRAGLYRAVFPGRRGRSAIASVVWFELPGGRFRVPSR